MMMMRDHNDCCGTTTACILSRQATRPWSNLDSNGKSYCAAMEVEGLGAVELGRRGSLRRVAHMTLGQNGCVDVLCVAWLPG